MSSSNSPVSLAAIAHIEAEIRANNTTANIVLRYKVSRKTVAKYRRNLRIFGTARPARIAKKGPSPLLDEEARDVGATRPF
jgi:DNA-binding CsgD family transcriptional regulator